MTSVMIAAPTRRRSVPAAAKLIETDDRRYLFVVDGSRLYELDATTADRLADAIERGSASSELSRMGLVGEPFIDGSPLIAPPVRSISLAVAQRCNLACTYCYAQHGEFGMEARSMTIDEAQRSIDLVLAGAAPGERVTVAFMGGEPLLNRAVVRATTEYASSRHDAVSFSITTNATLVNADDAEFFERYGFAVTVSIDGDRDTHDALRPFPGGRGSHDRLMARVTPFLAVQHRMQVSARVTVTPENLDVDRTVDSLLRLGFHSVGVSPMIHAPSGSGEVSGASLAVLLDRMIVAGRTFERRTLAGERYGFANMANAMREIDRGTHRPYPCGAGAGYLGVAAGGELSACHRFVGDAVGAMGSLDSGIDSVRRSAWLHDRHVDRQEPCRSCWARYLCGGGCHHEVLARGRPTCDYVRGWLEYCIGAYARLTAAGVTFTS